MDPAMEQILFAFLHHLPQSTFPLLFLDFHTKVLTFKSKLSLYDSLFRQNILINFVFFMERQVPSCPCKVRPYVRYVRYFSDNVQLYVRYAYTLFCRTLTSLYDENKLCVSYLQPKLTTVSTECVIDSRKRKQ